MSAGQLRERVAFERKALAADGYGNSQGDFVAQFERAARIQPLRGGETVMAGRLAGKGPANIEVRFDSQTRTVDTDWRIRDLRTDTIYNIRDIANLDERKRYLTFLAESGVAT